MSGRQLGAVVVLAGAVSFLASTAPVSGGWKHVTVTRSAGTSTALLSYDRRQDPYPGSAWTDYRRLTLILRQNGTRLVDYHYPHMLYGGVTRFWLRDVWGSPAPEALVELWTGGNACCERLLVGLAGPGSAGRVVTHDFPSFGLGIQRRNRAADFITSDEGFYCAFTSCADASQPIQIFAIDNAGRRFVDVTRTRADLIAADAAGQWAAYRREIDQHQYQHGTHQGSDPIGILAPWCADEYLLHEQRRCVRALDQAVTAGYLDGWHTGFEAGVNGVKGGHAIVAVVLKTLARWGYARQ